MRRRRRRHPRTLVGELKLFELQDRRRAFTCFAAGILFGLNIPSDITALPLLGAIELLVFVLLMLAAAYFALSSALWHSLRRQEEE